MFESLWSLLLIGAQPFQCNIAWFCFRILVSKWIQDVHLGIMKQTMDKKKCVPIPLGIYINNTFSLWNGHTLLALLACFNIQLAFIWMLRQRNMYSTMEHCIGTRAISVKQNLKKSLCFALINFFDTELLVSTPTQHQIFVRK